jgi:predicted phosphohydrolase
VIFALIFFETNVLVKMDYFLALMQGKSLAVFGELWKGSRNKAVKNAQAIRFK